MPSIINALSTGSGGLVSTADASGVLQLQTNGTVAIHIDSSQNVAIGASSASTKLLVLSGAGGNIANFSDGTQNLIIGTASGSVGYVNGASGVLGLYTSGLERARIDSSGYLWIRSTGGTSPWDATSGTYAKFGDIYPIGATAQSSIVAILNRNTTTGALMECKYNGNVVGSISVTGSNTAYNTSSDYRLKENIAPLTGSGEFIDSLKPKIGTWKADGSKFVGFLAHEVQEVSPQTVFGEKDAVDEEGKPIMQAMEYGSAEFIANIVAELQMLRKRVAQLEGK